MKKILVLLTAFVLCLNATYAEDSERLQRNDKQAQMSLRMQKEKAFEQRLGLTEQQKAKAKELRIKGHEKIKPVIEEIIAKKQEAKMVKMSRIAVEVQEERLAVIDKELKALEKKAHDIKKSNMKEFESILTRKQRNILKQMKKEGRKKYQENHPCQKPMFIPQGMKK